MKNLEPKNAFFNWVEPTRTHQGRNIGNVIRLHNKDGHKKLVIGSELLNELGLTVNGEIKVAFVLEDSKPLVVFNPVAGVPFYTAKLQSKKQVSPMIQNIDLMNRICKRFKITKNQDTVDFNLFFWERINGMDFYVLNEVV